MHADPGLSIETGLLDVQVLLMRGAPIRCVIGESSVSLFMLMVPRATNGRRVCLPHRVVSRWVAISVPGHLFTVRQGQNLTSERTYILKEGKHHCHPPRDHHADSCQQPERARRK